MDYENFPLPTSCEPHEHPVRSVKILGPQVTDEKTKVQGDEALVEGHTLHPVARARVRTCPPKHLPLELMLFLFYPLGLSERRQGAFLHQKPIGKTTRKKQLSFLPTEIGGHQL